jgi:hypothetical protein
MMNQIGVYQLDYVDIPFNYIVLEYISILCFWLKEISGLEIQQPSFCNYFTFIKITYPTFQFRLIERNGFFLLT